MNTKYSETKIRIRYGETDQMGIVYHGNYAQYLEMARLEWLRSFGMSYKVMESSGIILPVISLSLSFKKPAYYDDVITVKIQLVKLPTVRIEFNYEITNEVGEILTLGNTILAFVDKKTNKPMRCPKYILDKL